MSKTLTIYLAADLRKLNSGLRSAQSDMGRFERSIGGLSNTMGSLLGPALLGAAAAAGYMAVTLGVDGVKAAMEDEAAAAKLATTMENLGLANDTTAVEAMIDAQQRQYGIADDLLRPSMDRLIRATGDAAKANTALELAMNISAGTGKSLDSVVQALGKAYDGNTAGLSRLGAGLDKALLATGDMDAITKELANTFDGQAQTAANTYQGQLDRLSVGFGELQESFGTGFLNAMGKANSKTDDLMGTMKKLEPQLEKLGGKVYETAEGFVQAGVDASEIFDAINEGNWQRAWQIFAWGEDSLIDFTREANDAKVAAYGFIHAFDSMGGGDFAENIEPAAAATARYTGYAKALGHEISFTGGNLKEYFARVEETASGSSAATTATDLLSTAFELQSKVVAEGSEKLKNQTSALEKANAAVSQYASTLAGQLLGGIDLSAAQETGAELGIGTLAGLDAQIAQYDWFGNVLEEIKRQNGSQNLIDYIAAEGPEAGGRFGQEAIDKGLIPTFSSKLDAVIASANELGQAMVPEGLRAGVDFAQAGLQGIADEFSMNSDKLAKIGKRMGKTIGDNSRVEILKAVADAITEAEAARTAAEARNRATTAAANLLSDQQVAQAFSRIIQTSNSRIGYSMGVPIPSPVLG